MPYIKKCDRARWDNIIIDILNKLDDEKIDEEKLDGNLNYFITKLLKSIYSPSYYNYNRAIGLLECVKLELYRRDIAKYEDKKILDNGDVD